MTDPTTQSAMEKAWQKANVSHHFVIVDRGDFEAGWRAAIAAAAEITDKRAVANRKAAETDPHAGDYYAAAAEGCEVASMDIRALAPTQEESDG